MMVYYHNLEGLVKEKWTVVFKVKVTMHVNNSNECLLTIPCELLNLLLPNEVWRCIIASRLFWYLQGQGQNEGSSIEV